MGSSFTTRFAQDFGYKAPSSVSDELLDESQRVRPHWQYLIESLMRLGPAELSKRQLKIDALLRDDGASYHNYIKQQTDWQLDLLPWVIDSSQWSEIEVGLIERAELLDLMLKDLYGERTLIRRGLIPPEVIFGHQGYLRPCQGIQIPGAHQLIIHGADLVRSADGSMCVLADRTQAPSGAGYALENRTVMSRVLPSLFRDSHVHRLAVFFQNLRRTLVSLGSHDSAPNIAILTPGPYNETYFEHSYLATYLGFSLVQSSDLEIRNNYLWMKSLDGLTRVDVLLRRVDDAYCDPVELKNDSQLGIPGLLEVLRAGHLVIANPLGSGVLENPALFKFLPAISQHLIGRELRLDSVNTWWCGDPDDLDYVKRDFDNLIIKPLWRGSQKGSRVVSDLGEQARDSLLAQLCARPDQFVAQQKLIPSHVPALEPSGLSARPAVLRSFAVASDASYRIMPGGLTRVGTQTGIPMISNQMGSISKDTWIIASEPEKQVSLLPRIESDSHLMNQASGLPSRVVENLFWLGRYAERAEFGLRLLRTWVQITAEADPTLAESERRLRQALVELVDIQVSEDDATDCLDASVLMGMLIHSQRSDSLIGCLQSMLRCAEESRILMTSDAQRTMASLREQSDQLCHDLAHVTQFAPLTALNALVSSLLSFSGVTHESIHRGLGWTFMNIGRRLERALQTSEAIRLLLTQPLEPHEAPSVIETLLGSLEALNFYRHRYRGIPTVHNALDLLLLDPEHPRSMRYQIDQLDSDFHRLPYVDKQSRELDEHARAIAVCSSQLRLARLQDLCGPQQPTGQLASLASLLTGAHQALSNAAVAISDLYFENASSPQQLTG